ncbi:dihydroxy-acid dehydratase [Methylobacterium dankookense]|uniref:Dihydroxy-acid dehydratase n=1 Tax=Methylobacterium dankookense TaxID=560405 RepID=A0A564FVN4_9HYPH|nr:dihydroxy-acid dehydratase [Methylobacterium dankookense]GJD55079.1 Dihydroxy-acid dehydratase [Methylobacterium dankookense]VUF12077.1 Dihydroxy-acid dehydratase [Methylobacterium dankookense]
MSETDSARRLRSNFEPGSTRWAVRRAQWLAMGLSEEDLLKPKIAIVNSSSKLSVCYAHLDDICRVVERAIRAAGGVPFEIRTVAPSDFVTSAGRQARYLMPSRDLLVNDVEVQVEGAELDGMILLASCDKTTPGQLMAAGRLNVPAIVLPCGYQLGGDCAGRHVDIEEVYKSVGSLKAGDISLADLTAMTCHAIKGPGVCAGLATANTMHVLSEALGMALPRSAPIRAGSDALNASAERAGAAIVRLVEQDLRPRDILTPAAFRNAVRVAVATGCSVNCVRHLAAIAAEAEVAIDIVAEIEAVARLPQITTVRPNGPHRIEELDAAGGCLGVMRSLMPVLDTAALTVTGHPLAEQLAEAPAPDDSVIRPLDRPFRAEPGLTILRGSLAPDGAVAKLSAVPAEIRRFTGRARVFEDENRAIAALGTGAIVAGDVVVLRGLGPLGGPGTVFAASFMAALVGAGLGAGVAVVTDGELSGLNSGITIGQVMPEAAEGGPLGLVAEGDVIAIDLTDRSLDLQVDAATLAERRAAWQPPDHSHLRGWLGQYAQLVQPLAKGAVLGRPKTQR